MAESRSEPDLLLEMYSRPLFLSAARSMIGSLTQRLGFDELQSGQISLAVDEALCNVINHGYERREDGRIWLKVWSVVQGRPGIRIVIQDRARQVDPKVIQPRDLDDIRPGGLGVYIIREIMDDVSYEQRDGGGMQLTMHKLLSNENEHCSEPSVPVPGNERQES